MTNRAALLLALTPVFLFGQGIRQPDRVLYDTAMSDIQHKHFERARLSLQTLVNTYESSELLGPAKFAMAESWYREGGKHGMEQAETECKDFLQLYPNSPLVPQAQEMLRRIEAGKNPVKAKN